MESGAAGRCPSGPAPAEAVGEPGRRPDPSGVTPNSRPAARPHREAGDRRKPTTGPLAEPPMSAPPEVLGGIEVSKDHLDIACRPGPASRVANDPDGLAEAVARLGPM